MYFHAVAMFAGRWLFMLDMVPISIVAVEATLRTKNANHGLRDIVRIISNRRGIRSLRTLHTADTALRRVAGQGCLHAL
jgi:hypothetical protein